MVFKLKRDPWVINHNLFKIYRFFRVVVGLSGGTNLLLLWDLKNQSFRRYIGIYRGNQHIHHYTYSYLELRERYSYIYIYIHMYIF